MESGPTGQIGHNAPKLAEVGKRQDQESAQDQILVQDRDAILQQSNKKNFSVFPTGVSGYNFETNLLACVEHCVP